MLLRLVVRVGDRGLGVLGLPLLGAARALRQLPFVLEQVVEEGIAPPGGRLGPGDFQAAGDRIGTEALAVLAFPAEALGLDRRTFRVRTDQRWIASAMGLAEAMAAGDQRNRLLVVHRHARERLADVARRGDRIRVAVRSLRVDVDEAHLHRAKRLLQLALAAVARVAEPGALRAPIELLRLPDVGPPAGKAEGLEAHRFQRDVAGQDHQVGPGDLTAVFLLDRPEQPARLVEVRIVRPRVERCEALLAVPGATAPVGDPVGAGTVPGHADEQSAIVTEIGRPPILGVRHQCLQVLDDGIEVEGLELLGIVE